jgi:hypothetical protein
MIPAKTHAVLGEGGVRAAIRFAAHDDFAISGVDLNDLSCLTRRLGLGPAIGGDEMRDWQNRLALMIANASKLDELK